MAFNVDAARKSGYSDKEIAEYLGQQNKFDAVGAINAGYDPAELVDYLSNQAPKQSTIGSELIRGGKQLVSSTRSGIESIFNPEEAAKAGVARSEAIGKEAGEGVGFEPVKKAYQEKGLLSAAGEAVSQIPRALAGQGANLATMAGGARLGAMAGSAIAPGVGTVIGGALGAGATLLPQFMGSNVERQAAEQMEEGKDVKIDRTKAYAAAAGQAALEGAGTAFTLGKRVVKGVLGIVDDAALATARSQAELVKAAERSLAASAGRGAIQGAAEIPVEVSQQILERYQAGLSLTSPDALKEYGESAYQAALIGGPLGAAGKVVERGGARSQIAQQQAAEAQARAEQARNTNIGAQLPPETPVGTQGTLFTEEEMGKRVPTSKETPEPKSAAVQQGQQLDLGLDFQREYADMVKEREALKQQPQTPEVKARVDDLTNQIMSLHENEVASLRAEKQTDAEARARFPAIAGAPEPAQQSLFPETEVLRPEIAEPRLATTPKNQRQVEARRAQDEADAQAAADAAQKEQERKGGQYRLPLRTAPEDKNVNRDLKIPARPTEITMQDLEDIGVPLRTSKKWLEENVVGKTPAEIQVLVANDPNLILRKGSRAEILKYLTAPVPESFKEAPSVTPITKTNKPKPVVKPGGSEPSVGVSGQPASPQLVQPGPRVPTPAGAPATSVGLGLAPAGQPVSTGTGVARTQPTAVAPDVDSIQSFPNGPARITPKVIARDKPIYHETNTTGLDDLLRYDGQFEYSGAFVADNVDLALGQGGNTGVFIEFRPNSISGQLNPKLGTSLATGQEYKTDVIAPKAVNAITVKAGTKFNPRPTTRRILTAEFDKTTLSDGSTQYVRKGASPSLALPITWSPNAPTTTPAAPSPAAPAAPAAKPTVATEPTTKTTAPKETEAPTTSEPAEAVKSRYERLLDISNDESVPAATRKQAEKQMDLLDDPTMNASKEDRKGNEDYADRFLARVGGLKSVAIAEGQSLDALKDEVKNTKGILGAALRRLVTSGKVVLEAAHPSGKKIGGIFDGSKVTLYANGIPSGQSMAVALHEVGAHLGMEKMLGKKQYNAVIDRILDMVAKGDGSTEAKIAQAAYKRIPVSDFKRGAGRDEMVAYFIEEMAKAEAAGTLPKVGPLRNLWNQIKTAVITSINKALGTSFGVNSLSAQDILEIAKSSLVAESKTEVTKGDDKQMFSVSASTESLIDSMGPLSVPDKSALTKMVNTVRSEPDIDYTTKFRTQVADIGATIEKRLSEKFDGAVRDSLGKLNPMGLYRQAQDYTKMLLEYFQTGTLYKDPTTGLWKSGQGTGVRPPAEVYALIDKYAEKNGYSRDRATQIASRVLEGVRLDAMRTSNRTNGTNFLIHLKDNEIDQLVKEYNADPDLKEMSKLMDEARIAMVNNMVKAGRLSKEEGKAWSEVAGYVPFDRIEDFSTNFNKIKKVSGKGLAQVGKLPELVGSLNRPVGNVFDNYINTLGWMVGQTMKTDATVTTLRSLEDIGQANFLGRSAQGKPNVVGAYVDGEMMYWSVPSKYDVMAFKDLNPPKAGWLRNLGAFSNVLRKTVTILPPFALKQVTDDVQRAILTSGVKNPGALIWMSLTNFPKLALAELRGIQHPVVKEFGRMGLTGEYDFEAGKPATSLLKDLGYKKRTTFETILHRLDGITRASDLAVRKAIYDQTIKESGDAVLAQTRAREFINFRRRGASDFVGAMVTTIPFFNAYIQGMDVLYRAASGKDSSASVDRAQARRMFWSRAGTVMMLSSLYALGKDDDDEDYKNMDLRTRDSNWILPGGYKIPVPGELGAIFKVIPERIVEYMKRQGTPEEQEAFEAVRTTLSYMFEQYLGRAVPVPQAIKPVMEAWANKSFLTGRDLEGYHHKAMDPSARITEQTSELAKAISVFSRDQIGPEISPIMIDNALRGYFGSSAALLTMVTDSLLNPTRIDRPLHKYALLSNYLYDPVGTRRMTEFYEEREKVGKANTTLNELMKTDLDRAEKYAEAHANELMMESAINSTLEQLERTRAYRKYLNSAEGAKDMSKEDREADLKEIKQMELEFVGWLREAKAELRKVQ